VRHGVRAIRPGGDAGAAGDLPAEAAASRARQSAGGRLTPHAPDELLVSPLVMTASGVKFGKTARRGLSDEGGEGL